MNEWWYKLTPNSRLMVKAGGIFIFILICYFYLWSPILTHIDNLQQQVRYQQQSINLMQHAVQQLQAVPHVRQRKMVSETELLSLLAIKLKQSSLANYSHQLQQTQDGKIQLKFDSIPFDQFILWLINLYHGNVFEIDKLDVQAANEPGMVKLMVILKG